MMERMFRLVVILSAIIVLLSYHFLGLLMIDKGSISFKENSCQTSENNNNE